MTNRASTNIIRAGFLGWWVFELLNWMKVLHFTLDFSWYGLFITVTWIWAAMEIVSWRLKKSGMEPLPWAVYLAGFIGTSMDALGDVAHLYTRIMYYDKYAHFFGGAAAGLILLFIYRRLHQSGRIRIGPAVLGLFAVWSANFLGLLYELEEYSESLLLHNNRMGDAFDTSTDVLFNMAGAFAIVTAVLFVIYAKNKNTPGQHQSPSPAMTVERKSWGRHLVRLGFVGWACFALLNLASLVHTRIDYSWAGLLATVLFVWMALEYASNRFRRWGLQPVSWLIYLIGLAGVSWNVLITIAHLNRVFDWRIQLVHGVSGAAAAAIFFYIFWRMMQAGRIRMSATMLGFLTFCGAAFLSALYTFSEFFETKLLHTGRLVSGEVGGFAVDNNFLWNIIGAAVCVYVIAKITRRIGRLQPPPM